MAATTHRKLFPMSATAANQSLDCPDFCDPACPYNCPYPDFYFLPPPPPPENHSVHSLHFSLAAIVSVSVLAGVFLVLSYYVIIKRFRNGDPVATRSNDSEEFLEDGYRVDHPVWFIATAGLRPAVINSITACRYKKNDGLVEGTECSVCLAEFREDETLRIMPKCNHAFHIPCIDTWLRSHTNCPLCRASIVSEPVVAAATPAEAETQMGNSVDGDRDGTEDETEVPKDGVNSEENGDSVAINIDVEDEVVREDEVRQPPRRSVSLALGRNEECSSGSDKSTLNGV